jgi:hypothetical protein
MLNLLDSEDHADVFFEVDGEKIAAHRLILEVNAPVLANVCGEESSATPVACSKVQNHVSSG